jgi:hypothetical protein
MTVVIRPCMIELKAATAARENAGAIACDIACEICSGSGGHDIIARFPSISVLTRSLATFGCGRAVGLTCRYPLREITVSVQLRRRRATRRIPLACVIGAASADAGGEDPRSADMVSAFNGGDTPFIWHDVVTPLIYPLIPTPGDVMSSLSSAARVNPSVTPRATPTHRTLAPLLERRGGPPLGRGWYRVVAVAPLPKILFFRAIIQPLHHQIIAGGTPSHFHR